MHAAEERGEIPKGTAKRWEKHTKDKDLPEKVAKKGDQLHEDPGTEKPPVPPKAPVSPRGKPYRLRG